MQLQLCDREETTDVDDSGAAQGIMILVGSTTRGSNSEQMRRYYYTRGRALHEACETWKVVLRDQPLPQYPITRTDMIEGILSEHGAAHYGLEKKKKSITRSWDVPAKYEFGGEDVVIHYTLERSGTVVEVEHGVVWMSNGNTIPVTIISCKCVTCSSFFLVALNQPLILRKICLFHFISNDKTLYCVLSIIISMIE